MLSQEDGDDTGVTPSTTVTIINAPSAAFMRDSHHIKDLEMLITSTDDNSDQAYNNDLRHSGPASIDATAMDTGTNAMSGGLHLSDATAHDDFRALRSKVVKFRIVYHNGTTICAGSSIAVAVATNDSADTVTCRVFKAFGVIGANYVLMHFTAPKIAGKRLRPVFAAIHEHAEVYMHLKPADQSSSEIDIAGIKRAGLEDSEAATHHIKRQCVGECDQQMR